MTRCFREAYAEIERRRRKHLKDADEATDTGAHVGIAMLHINAARGLSEALDVLDRERAGAGGQDTPFPDHERIRILSEATLHLLDDHDCDHLGWETWRAAALAPARPTDEGRGE